MGPPGTAGRGVRDGRRDREYRAIGMNAVLLALAVVVAWGRFGPYSF
ncbi:hypothetical protein [Streptomyces sp. NPDC101237]